MRNVVCARAWIVIMAMIVGVALLGTALVSTPIAAASVPQQSGTTVAVSPAQTNLQCGQTAVVDIRINNVQDLFGVDIKVSYDPNLVEVVDANATALGIQVQPGDFLDVSGGQGLIQVNSVDAGTGTISYAAIRLNPAPGQTGSGVIASITFRGKAAGTGPVKLESVMLSNPTAQPISANLTNGQVTVTCTGQPTATTVPGPTATTPHGWPTRVPTPGPNPVPVPGKNCTHVVKPGDTVYSIARRYGTDVYAIAQANKLANPNWIFVGQTLIIPGCTPTPPLPPGPPPGNCYPYSVKPGDTLYHIALTNGVSVSELARSNGIVNPNLIYVGQVIKICRRGWPGPVPPPPCKATYTVMPGDTLYGISLRYGASVYALAAANKLANPNLIYAGQMLCIP